MAALEWGPIALPLHVGPVFFFYLNGIISTIDCLVGWVNHVVMVVGHGYSYTNKTHYLILRNAWGKTWGDKGYAYLQWDHDGALNPCNIRAKPMALVQPLGWTMDSYSDIVARRAGLNPIGNAETRPKATYKPPKTTTSSPSSTSSTTKPITTSKATTVSHKTILKKPTTSKLTTLKPTTASIPLFAILDPISDTSNRPIPICFKPTSKPTTSNRPIPICSKPTSQPTTSSRPIPICSKPTSQPTTSSRPIPICTKPSFQTTTQKPTTPKPTTSTPITYSSTSNPPRPIPTCP